MDIDNKLKEMTKEISRMKSLQRGRRYRKKEKDLKKPENARFVMEASLMAQLDRIEKSTEELFQASVHLHKDVHMLEEKLDRIEKGEFMSDELDNVYRKLNELGRDLNKLSRELHSNPEHARQA